MNKEYEEVIRALQRCYSECSNYCAYLELKLNEHDILYMYDGRRQVELHKALGKATAALMEAKGNQNG